MNNSVPKRSQRSVYHRYSLQSMLPIVCYIYSSLRRAEPLTLDCTLTSLPVLTRDVRSQMSSVGVPPVPASVEGVAELAAFVAIWRRVLEWEKAEGMTPCSAGTVLAPTDDTLQMMTPMDVGDPFIEDAPLQKCLVRRHVLTTAVRPDTGDASATSLDGSAVRVAAGPSFTAGDAGACIASAIGDTQGELVVYSVSEAFVSCSEVTAAIGRHPQSNPFHCDEPVPEPEPQ